MNGWDDRAGYWRFPAGEPLPAPAYRYANGPAVMLAVECFARHMSSEGWQLQEGLRGAGVTLIGRNYPDGEQNAAKIVADYRPAVAIVQDEREWDAKKPGCFDKHAEFAHVETLQEHSNIFRLTILKDAHHDAAYTRANHERMGAHAWLHYYHPAIVCRLAPWLRPEHMIRVHHTVEPANFPEFVPASERSGCLLPGCIAPSFYPMRSRLLKAVIDAVLPETDYWGHPGYHANGHATPDFIRRLARYKAAICTTSIFGYSLRKIIESVACGAVPITDLPEEDTLPVIDPWLVRVPFESGSREVAEVIRRELDGYDEDFRREGARRALRHYDYRMEGRRLVTAIDEMRSEYDG